MNTKDRSSLLVGASLAAAAAFAPAAQAQTAPAPAPRVTDEIVVTATGRAQALQDVPIAVTALAAEQLQNAGVTDVRTLEQVAPSFRFATGQSNAAGTTAYIRGLGTGADNVGFESAVGFFIDGVYRARPGVALSQLPELERVEVLRGPQGTLFGKNTTAGAISITTLKPEFDWRRFASASVSNYNGYTVQGGVTGPLVNDVLAVRVEGAIEERDGTIDDANGGPALNDRDRSSARGQLLWDISPDATLRVIADYATTNELCCYAVIVREGPTSAALNLLTQATQGRAARPALNPQERVNSVTPGRRLQEDTDDKGLSAELNWDFGGVNFTSVTSYRDWTAVRGQDIDFSGADRAYRAGQEVGIETSTQEFRLQGERGRLDWLFGAFYSNETLNNVDRIRFGSDGAAYGDTLLAAATGRTLYGPAGTRLFEASSPAVAPLVAGLAATPVAPGVTLGTANATAIVNAYAAAIAATRPAANTGQNADRFTVDSQSWSLFTHNVIGLTDRLDLTLGARYNNETKDLTANLDATAATCDVLRSTASIVPGVPISFAAITSQLQASPAAASALVLACNPVINTIANGRFADDREDKEWNGTASLAFKATDDMLLYASYARGYKSGGYNLDRSGFPLTNFAAQTPPPASALEFKPEFADSYEAGFKATVPAIAGTFNGTVFYTSITDYQLNAFTGFNFRVISLGEVVSQGVELELQSRPTDALTLTGALVYTDAEITKDSTSNVLGQELGGKSPGNAPPWVLTAALTYDKPLPGTNLRGLFYIDGRYNSEHPIQSLGRDPAGSTDNDAFAVFNARLGIGAENRSWSVEAYVRNLTDEFYNLLGFGVPEQTGTFAVYPSEPRTYGVTFRTSF